MSNMLLRLLRQAGIVKGQVLTFRNPRVAAVAAMNHGRAVVSVPDTPICGTHWLMEPDDAQRMQELKGYKIEVPPPEAPAAGN